MSAETDTLFKEVIEARAEVFDKLTVFRSRFAAFANAVGLDDSEIQDIKQDMSITEVIKLCSYYASIRK